MIKVDLHCHLDGSLDIDFVHQTLKNQGVFVHKKDLDEKLKVQEDCSSLTEYLEKFNIPLRCTQTKDDLENAAYWMIRNASKEGVKYIEVRFAPMLHTRNGLTCTEVVESVYKGLSEASKECGVFSSIIVCAMRHHSVEKNLQMLQEIRRFIGNEVCALDLAGDESVYPTKLFRELFVRAKEWNIPFTIHSGECGSVENIKEAIELGAKRIGHGIALQKSPELRKLCREKSVGIEMCPTSNLQTKSVDTLEQYPLKQFLEEGLLVSINTDNRTVSNTTVSEEEKLVQKGLGVSDEMILGCTRNAIATSFATDVVKKQLYEMLE